VHAKPVASANSTRDELLRHPTRAPVYVAERQGANIAGVTGVLDCEALSATAEGKVEKRAEIHGAEPT